ncbi:hypothetical protein A1O3_04669 [Capronia epimyces CBS 606.96]|uniref:UV radiation resistance associated protein n=1 Tax=Capronia epimyces CBS 606.96 TaxID=1182542 RepID=W9XTX9_9EURO|nr:uncharacterized protein A1O3_04669 [Capronia epimyces CBS 606.96]EXJ84002.1 hypothetical protein A1O3_04669 [Capronia epimyces CBS 606.96]
MAEHGDESSLTSKPRNERPFLYPWNRRLRHLHGISLRNLHITAPGARRRAKTITDDDALYSLASPTKRALQNDTKQLAQSRSFADLSSALDDPFNPIPLHKASTSYDKNEVHSNRPSGGRMRRSSTLHWASASPRTRQSKLEDIVVSRLADSWISVHCPGSSEPIYISEVIERSMNPSFAFFDLDSSGSHVSRSAECAIRVWARSADTEEYCLLVELDLDLRSLQFLGRSLEKFHHPLPQNCILLHLSDGIYTSFTDLPAEPHPMVDQSINHRDGASNLGSSFDALMQLANLDDCIQDAVKVRSQIEDDINTILAEANVLNIDDEADPGFDGESPQAKAALAAEQKRLRQLKSRRDELEQSLERRRHALAIGRETLSESRKLLGDRSQACKDLETRLQHMETEARGQIRRICEALLNIFPIEPFKSRTLQFTICGIYLPNSVYDDTNRDEISAALGFTAQLVHQLALYLSTPLPYPLEPYGSTSFISDPVSIGLSQRKYPLHPTSVPYKFEYAVFLLNKDIEFLMSRAGLRVLDIRHTLPNLKYLLYVLTAGTGDLPARKAGGVRGLLGGRISSDVSRRTSSDSLQSIPALSNQDTNDAKVNGGFGGTKEKQSNDSFVSTSPAQDLSYRTGFSGLRDRETK